LKDIRDFFKMNKWTLVAIFITFVALSIVIFLQNYDKLIQFIDLKTIIYWSAEKLLIMTIFLLLFKIILATKLTYGAFKRVGLLSLTDEEVISNMEKEKRIEVVKKIANLDYDCVSIVDIKNEEGAKKEIEEAYDSKSEYPYILLESDETQTLYSNGHYIWHKKARIKMMKTKPLKVNLDYIPFDEIINENPKQDEYWLKKDSDRWPSCKESQFVFPHKTFKFYCPGDTIQGLKPDIETYTDKKNGKKWLRFLAKTEQAIKKDTEFVIEILVTDYVNFDISFKERRKAFFSNDFQTDCGIRRIKFQTEIYNDRNTRLPFYPTIKIDGDDIGVDTSISRRNCKENMFYRFWEWKILYGEEKNENYSFDLIDLNADEHIVCGENS